MIKGIRHVHYTLDRVYNSYAARFANAVGLVPFMGMTDGPKAIGRATLDLLGQWRARVALFQAWGLAPPCPVRESGPSKLSVMYNCPPALAVCKSTPLAKALFCNVKPLCPSCAARAALPIWQQLDRRLFGIPSAGDSIATAAAPGAVLARALSFDDDPADAVRSRRRLEAITLLARTITYTLPFDDPRTLAGLIVNRASRTCTSAGKSRRSSTGVPSRATEIARLTAAGVTGGLDTMHVGLRYDRDGKDARPTAWSVEVRQLVTLPSERADAIILSPALTQAPTTKAAHTEIVLEPVPGPTRLDVLRGVALSLRHSRVPMSGSRDQVIEYLAARQGRRTSATFGSWYGAAARR